MCAGICVIIGSAGELGGGGGGVAPHLDQRVSCMFVLMGSLEWWCIS